MRPMRVVIGSLQDKPELIQWEGKLVGYDGWGWSLDGRPSEGIALSAPDHCFEPVSEADEDLYDLLQATFWHRDHYTEDLEELKALPKDPIDHDYKYI
jgi:hypothetical protein